MKNSSQVSRASAYDSRSVEVWGRASEYLDEHVDEGAADSLEEKKDGRHFSQIRSRGGSLNSDDRDLGCNTPANTSDDLIPDPFRPFSTDAERIK